MNNDDDLLRLFAETQDESCFATFVQRHIGFVYAVSARRLRDPHAAQDATQAVFVALARKAGAVARCPSVIGWLHRSAVFETRNIMRAQGNRLARETEAQRLGTTTPEARANLGAIEAILDDVLDDLSSADREAILARYFSGFSYAEIGTTLRLSENASNAHS
jgi:RNA polymerase sigma factor (sigma-70 family)